MDHFIKTDSYVCVDLETTGLNPKTDRIIEIGAVRVEHGVQTGTFETFVNPGRLLPEAIVGLTGIRDEDVADAPSFAAALADFAAWIGDRPARIYSWSLSDWYQLDDECYLKELEMPWQLRQRWMDFQAVYTRLIGLSNAHPLSLKYAIGAAEQTFDGSAHRAVDDAANSAELLRMVKAGRLQEQARIIHDALRPKEKNFSMGDALKDQLAAWQAQHSKQE